MERESAMTKKMKADIAKKALSDMAPMPSTVMAVPGYHFECGSYPASREHVWPEYLNAQPHETQSSGTALKTHGPCEQRYNLALCALAVYSFACGLFP